MTRLSNAPRRSWKRPAARPDRRIAAPIPFDTAEEASFMALMSSGEEGSATSQ